MTHKVTIYTTASCHYCKETKAFFNEHDVKYTEIDVAKDREALKEMVEKSGSQGVPVTVIDDNWDDAVIGFNEGKLKEKLNLAS
ncbi:MAG: glutaredoxin family protein [Nanoarchaeota archaeon]|nr:glutaredoxin family protein [Nanoarchaeota archaeon]